MSQRLRAVAEPPPPDARRALRQALRERGRPLQVVAEDISGLAGGTDLLAVDPQGGVVGVWLVRDPDDGLEAVAAALAQRAGLAERIAEWNQLAPQLELDPDAPVGLVLVAPDFPAAAREAARQVPGLTLVRVRFVCADDGPAQALLETLSSPSGASPPLRSVFRTGLSDADLLADPQTA